MFKNAKHFPHALLNQRLLVESGRAFVPGLCGRVVARLGDCANDEFLDFYGQKSNPHNLHPRISQFERVNHDPFLLSVEIGGRPANRVGVKEGPSGEGDFVSVQ